jgi:hypothetical protein
MTELADCILSADGDTYKIAGCRKKIANRHTGPSNYDKISESEATLSAHGHGGRRRRRRSRRKSRRKSRKSRRKRRKSRKKRKRSRRRKRRR